MLKIGLTGGIGCGKSLVAHLLRLGGIKIISADEIAKEIMNTHPIVKARLIAEFGAKIYHPTGKINRKQLAAIIFSNDHARKNVNAIVHPYVIQRQEEELSEIWRQGRKIIAGVEAALIFEAKTERHFDAIIVVSAPVHSIIERLQIRDGLSREEILNRIHSQMPLDEKIKRADYVIHNDGTIEELKTKVTLLIHWLHDRVKR